ncbi:hypothetical protein GCM10025791_44900 [Halioxenophilus aromaticivorans]|uniref:Uncharacterized protein n=2 Tax=Halioxenophilus aromaticivorans TaxID=1306992 RepID=A0AAV3U8H9_9ALTE
MSRASRCGPWTYYLADQVVEPMLTAMAEPIALWRFHRRAGRDKAGHQFSFMFYTDDGTAQQVFTRLEQHPLAIAKPAGLYKVLYQRRAVAGHQ